MAAAPKKAPKKVPKKSAGKKTRRRRGVKIQPTELTASELSIEPEGELAALGDRVRGDGGAVLGAYREPLGGHALLLVSLPIERVQPTPFQRDVSDAHVRKLTRAMDKTRRFLDPIIVVRGDDGYLTPNGNHRLTVLAELGAKAVVGLLVPEAEVAFHILALNIEKAHNLRERAIEVVRMYRELAKLAPRKEPDFELEFEEPSLVTLGFGYEKRGRLSGGAYHPVLKRVDGWIDAPLTDAIAEREKRAALLLDLDDAVGDAVKRLKDAGLSSPYLKNFVVARINPLRFIKGDPPPLEELLPKMAARARGMDAGKIKPQDLANSGGSPAEG
jgi:ParB family chromosome partitioning protein